MAEGRVSPFSYRRTVRCVIPSKLAVSARDSAVFSRRDLNSLEWSGRDMSALSLGHYLTMCQRFVPRPPVCSGHVLGHCASQGAVFPVAALAARSPESFAPCTVEK